jgi:hypothetical protein
MSLRMGDAKIHELYTAACGLYMCWLGMRVCNVLAHWIPQGWGAILQKLREWIVMVRIVYHPSQSRHFNILDTQGLQSPASWTGLLSPLDLTKPNLLPLPREKRWPITALETIHTSLR